MGKRKRNREGLRLKPVWVNAGQLVLGPVQHATLAPALLPLIRWTYEVVGRYRQPTLEGWELGFMRDAFLARELAWWHRASFAFITYHRRRGLPLRAHAEAAALVEAFCRLLRGSPLADPREAAFLSSDD